MTQAHIRLDHVTVEGVDTQARANSLRQMVLLRKSINPPPIPIVTDISLDIKKGDKVALIGSNGSGKSSLLKVISGNYPPQHGSVHVTGTVVPLIEMGAGFDAETTGRENIKLSFAYRGKLRLYSRELEEKIIAFSELGEKIDLPFKNYSSGMAARLAFSSAIFQKPDILLLDEVLSTGDAGFVKKSTNAIQQLLKEAAIAIVVSHDFKTLKTICNRFILMHHSRIVAEGDAETIEKHYKRLLAHG